MENVGEKRGADNVKIDAELLNKVKSFIKYDPIRIKYSSAKQFVDIAVLELLKKEEKEDKNE